VKRVSKPNKKITTASQLLPVHGLLSNVFAHNRMYITQKKTGLLTLDDFFAFFGSLLFFAHFSPISSGSNF
jgi:hypothetical protein